MNDGVRAAIIALHQRGVSIRQIARQLRVGNATVYKALQAVADPTTIQASPDLSNAFRTPLRRSEPGRNGVSARPVRIRGWPGMDQGSPEVPGPRQRPRDRPRTRA